MSNVNCIIEVRELVEYVPIRDPLEPCGAFERDVP